MTEEVEIRDPDEARRWVCAGLCMMRAVRPAPAHVRPALDWALALLSEGHRLPPLGVVADIGHLVLGTDRGASPTQNPATLADWPLSAYEDFVLGKLFADRSFERAADAVRRLPPRDRRRGIAYIIDRFRARTGFAGTVFSPAVLKELINEPADAVLAKGWSALENIEGAPGSLYQSMINAVRSLGDVLGPDDVFELEHGTAVSAFGQRLALRQVVRAAARFDAALPHLAPDRRGSRREVPTLVQDEDTYPVGGFATIANRGSLESLLHSQLAFMESNRRGEPDLFDIKFLRDELLYYSRDENQFFRRRRRFFIDLDASLVHARIKDAGAPYQRIVLALGWVVTLIDRLTRWLDRDALSFALHFPPGGAMAAERELAGFLFREMIASGLLHLVDTPLPVKRDGALLRISCEAPRDDLLPHDSCLLVGAILQFHAGNGLSVYEGKPALEQWQVLLEEQLAAWI